MPRPKRSVANSAASAPVTTTTKTTPPRQVKPGSLPPTPPASEMKQMLDTASSSASTGRRGASRASRGKAVKEEVEQVEQAAERQTTGKDGDSAAPSSPSKQTQSEKKLNLLRNSLDTGPFPNHVAPTSEQAWEVAHVLREWHGYKDIPRKTTNMHREDKFGGCGNVPNVLDALIRTVMSCNTSSKNSTAAHKAMCEAYGSKNFQALLDAPHAQLAEVIRCGGLHDRKARIIQGILRRTSELHGVLSLDHLHSAPARQVMEELVAFDGVGPKVASCCSAFCIGNDEMAVDTHVYRLSKALGWVPDKATRDQTYFHLAERLPSELKYGLHVLLIRHGKSCANCSAKGFATDQRARRQDSEDADETGARDDSKTNVAIKKEESGTQELAIKAETEDAGGVDEQRDAKEQVREVKEEADKEHKAPAALQSDVCPLKAAGLLGKGKSRVKKSQASPPAETHASPGTADATGKRRGRPKKESAPEDSTPARRSKRQRV
ncbi:DNA glycosylase [Ceraceosorus guamensis]|uniref:DNA glycosylase n=1 Tax=Ceraceosorus guamensis TaxID=1522189 RepID=A0A316W380_9BASI|nr:DNA glycosylase [Ceraceosorus guamensis]PWN43051.1 DNA glycosylase [Ceraceosorus guamensis]